MAPGFTMPAFSTAIRVEGRAEVFDVVDAHVRDHGDRAVGDIRRVPGSSDAHLDDGGLHGEIGEPPERAPR